MLLQRVWDVCRLRNTRRLGMLGGTLASCALALITIVPSAYALACGNQNHHKVTQASTSQHVQETTQASKCPCQKDHHPTGHHKSDGHGSVSVSVTGNLTGNHPSPVVTGNHPSPVVTGNHPSAGGGSSTHGGSTPPKSTGGGSGSTPGLPFTGSDPN